MDAAEFLRRVRKFGRANGLAVELDASQGKGGHAMLYLGPRRTVLPMHSGREIGKGLLHSMLRDLGLKIRDL